MIHYFGTDFDDFGHYLWDVGDHHLLNSRLKADKTMPLSISQLENLAGCYESKLQRNGDAAIFHIGGFTYLAIAGSVKDSRPNSKTIFFIKGTHTKEEFINQIILTNFGGKVLSEFPYQINWKVLQTKTT